MPEMKPKSVGLQMHTGEVFRSVKKEAKIVKIVKYMKIEYFGHIIN